MPPHNPEPFTFVPKDSMDAEIAKFVVSVSARVEQNRTANRPLMMFVKWELPTKTDAEYFLKTLLSCLQSSTKHVFTKTLHYSQLATAETKDNQLDLLIGIGLDAANFKKALQQVILMINSKNGQLGITTQAQESGEGGKTASNP